MVGDAFPVRGIGNALAEGGQVVGLIGHLDVGQQLTALSHQVQATPEQVARRTHAGRVDVGLRQHPASEQHGDLVGVDLVVLGLAAVNGLHEQCMAEHEADAFPRAQIGEPIPGVDALAGHHEVVAVGSHGFEKRLGLRGQVLVNEPPSHKGSSARIASSMPLAQRPTPTVTSSRSLLESLAFGVQSSLFRLSLAMQQVGFSANCSATFSSREMKSRASCRTSLRPTPIQRVKRSYPRGRVSTPQRSAGVMRPSSAGDGIAA